MRLSSLFHWSMGRIGPHTSLFQLPRINSTRFFTHCNYLGIMISHFEHQSHVLAKFKGNKISLIVEILKYMLSLLLNIPITVMLRYYLQLFCLQLRHPEGRRRIVPNYGDRAAREFPSHNEKLAAVFKIKGLEFYHGRAMLRPVARRCLVF